MKKIVIALFIILGMSAFADSLTINYKGLKINLSDNGSYSFAYDGDVATLGNGKKVLLKKDFTWEYLQDYSNAIVTDNFGKKLWIRKNGRWGYMKTFNDDNFKFRGISLKDRGRKTGFEGIIQNTTNDYYVNLKFDIIVFDNDEYEYKKVGEIFVPELAPGMEAQFSAEANVSKENIVTYYAEYKSGDKKEVINVKSRKKGKTLGEALEELDGR